MIFRRGIFLGIIMVIGSMGGILNKNLQYPFEVSKILSMVFWIVTGAIGIAQIVAAINYLKTSKAKILVFCFVLEGIYYALMTIVLLSMKIDIVFKIFGVVTACVMFIVIYTAINNLWEKIASQR